MTRVIIPKATHMAIVNGGDGSAYALFFSSAEGAERYMEEDPERFCDDILDISRGIEVDPVRPGDLSIQIQDMEELDFMRRLSEFIADPNRLVSVAEHFECGVKTIALWANGSIPISHGLRDQVLEFIARLA